MTTDEQQYYQELKLVVSETYHDSEFENKGRYFANINPVTQDENDRDERN